MKIIDKIKRFFGWDIPYRSVIHATNKERIEITAGIGGLNPKNPNNWATFK